MTAVERALRRLVAAQARVIREVMSGGDAQPWLRLMYEAGDALAAAEVERPPR